MKIAIASDDGIHVVGHAGRSEGFVVMEYDGHSVTHREYRKSPMPGHVHAGERHHAHMESTIRTRMRADRNSTHIGTEST